jgi:hypothetical protein
MQAIGKVVVVAGLLLFAPAAWAQTASQTDGDESTARAEVTQAPPRLAGTWTAKPERLPLLTDFDKSVWGLNAQSEQTVSLTLNASGEGTLTVKRRVIDARGRTVLGSASVEEAKIRVGAATGPAVATRLDHPVEVISAERRHPDDPKYRWPIDGARVNVVTFEGGDANTLELRYDTPDGKVALIGDLHRVAAKAPRAAPARTTAKPAAKPAK